MKLTALILTVLLCNVCFGQIPCNNWLYNPSVSSTVNIGDLDVSGNQITVEAIINRTTPYLPGGLDDSEGDVVSKHNSPADVNYLLRPNHAYITTTNGFFSTPDICDLELNKIYHIAMVYDGSTLKFYRDGFLMSQVNATGNLFLNNWNTQIGHYDPSFWKTQFVGYTNEVRIWDVARTQAQIKTYMNNSLPNPTTQTGLLAYYTFDNLINKQGNAVYNGTLTGNAVINSTNTICTFTADSCFVPPISCNNWLSNPSSPSYAEVGQVNITGNKITVEAVFNRTTPYSGGLLYAGDLVSKHNTPADANYLLRPNNAEITTSNGYFRTPDICEIELNKTYHVAMVYDGATLKFYRNGFLMSQVAATGNLFQNNWKTRIGFYEPQAVNTNFIGFINEVRIWNVEKSQAAIRSLMNTSLPNPTAQPGLVAYYTFDDLLNKQGNALYNAVLGGGASINAVNPNCNLIIDSCATVTSIPGISKIINDYTPVIALNPCTNKLTVEDATKYNAGDTVLIIQMKGAIIDSSNTASFGIVTDYKNAGNYEFNYVKSKAGNIIELKNILTRQYDVPDGKVQLVRVPYFKTAIISDTLTCLTWDGSKGGVLVLNVKDTLSLNNNIDVTGKGFRKGIMHNSLINSFSCGLVDYFYPINTIDAAGKGESIADVDSTKNAGWGAKASGGGGGMNPNTGGGGGGNGAKGGIGGYGYGLCANYTTIGGWGLGGNGLAYNSVSNKFFLGGAGGAGHCNNGFDDLLTNTDFDGGNGGGMVLIAAPVISGNGNSIIANGDKAYELTAPGYLAHDGMGGGGAGGTVLINTNSFITALQIKINGGKGGDMSSSISGGKVGPGGGGAGGVAWFSQNTVPSNVTVQKNGGLNGVILDDSNNPYGATAGLDGVNVFNLFFTIDATPFKINIDSVRIKSAFTSCNVFNFNGLGYTNTAPINKWQWFFDDGSNSVGQTTTHSYNTTGIHPVKLVVTDINGCSDSVTADITADALPANPTYVITQPTCANTFGSLNITNPVGANFKYSIDGTNYQVSPVFSNLPVRSYNLTVVNTTTNCVSLPINLSINAAALPAAATTSIIQPSCTNPSGTINITGPLGSDLQYSIDGINYQTSTTFTNLVTGLYSLTVKNITSTCVSLPANATIDPPLTAPAIPSSNIIQPVCSNQNGAITVTAPLGVNLQYSIDDTNYQAGTNFNNVAPGNYRLSVKNTTTNCISLPASIFILTGTGTPASPTAAVNIQPDCIVITGTASVSAPLGSNYQYSFDGSTFQVATIFTNLVPSNYNVSVKDIVNGCISTATPLTVNATPPPPAAPEANALQPTCAITTGTINVTSPTGNNIQFNLNGAAFQSGTSFPELAPSSYSVTAKNTTTQCISTAKIVVINPIPSPPLAPTIGNIIQPSCTIQKGTVTISAPTGNNFEYSINGSGFQAANSFTNLASGNYNLAVRDIATSCISMSTATTINPPPALPPTPVARVTEQPTCIVSAGTIVVSVPSGANYQYSIDGLQYQSSVTFTNLAPGTYQLTVKDQSIDCISLPLTIVVKANINSPGSYLIPTAFTPNHDGINECFGIKYWGVVSEFKLMIYNRWGQTVFSTTDPNDCWDGVYKGVAASQGNYIYYIKAKTLCGPIEKRGNVMLVK